MVAIKLDLVICGSFIMSSDDDDDDGDDDDDDRDDDDDGDRGDDDGDDTPQDSLHCLRLTKLLSLPWQPPQGSSRQSLILSR